VRKVICTLILIFLTMGYVSRATGMGSLRTRTYKGKRYYSLRDVASYYGMKLRVPRGKHIYLESRWSKLVFEVNSRQASYNGIDVWLHSPVVRSRGRWLITDDDVKLMIDPLLRPDTHIKTKGARVVVLDPGHGGEDTGARGYRNIEEKRAVLDIAKRARVYLANAGLKVYLTRETDRYITLNGRTAKAAKSGADLFVSIHLNSAASTTAKGIETYALALQGHPSTSRSTVSKGDKRKYAGNKHDGANVLLSYYLQKALVNRTGSEDRGVRRARFVVLKNAPCPAALVECGFVSNKREAERFLERKYRDAVALAIARGVLDYVKIVNRAELSER